MATRKIGKTKAGAIITIGRSDSKGLEGTYENCDDHAENLIPLVKSLLPMAKTVDVKEWRQFNNVHYLFCHSGRILFFEGHKVNREYVGIRFGIKYCGLKVPLFLYTDTEQLLDFWQLIAILAAEPNIIGKSIINLETQESCEEAKV
jgi:hypothetical protein